MITTKPATTTINYFDSNNQLYW